MKNANAVTPASLSLIALALMTFTAASSEAFACTLTNVRVEGGQVSLVYDPFAPDGVSASLPVRVETEGDCSGATLEISIQPDAASASPAALILSNGVTTLPVSVQDRSGRSVLTVGGLAPTANRVARIPLGNGQGASSDTLIVALDRGLAAQSGSYDGRANAVVRLANDARTLSAPFDISALVIASVGLAAAGEMRLDVGEIRTGARVQTRFVAYANTDYDLNIRSDNNWTLRSEAGSVPYRLTVSGRDVRRDAVANVEFQRPRADGRRVHELQVTIPETRDPAAGEYRDFITVEISARL